MFGIKILLTSLSSGLYINICTGGKDGFYSASFIHFHIQTLGDAPYGCEEFFYSWGYERRDLHESTWRVHIRPNISLQTSEIIVGIETCPKSLVCKDGLFSAITKICKIVWSKCVPTTIWRWFTHYSFVFWLFFLLQEEHLLQSTSSKWLCMKHLTWVILSC